MDVKLSETQSNSVKLSQTQSNSVKLSQTQSNSVNLSQTQSISAKLSHPPQKKTFFLNNQTTKQHYSPNLSPTLHHQHYFSQKFSTNSSFIHSFPLYPHYKSIQYITSLQIFDFFDVSFNSMYNIYRRRDKFAHT